MRSRSFKRLDGSMLKLIAVISMAVDHTAFALGPVLPAMGIPLLTVLGKELTLYYIMRKIGRLAFPIYCFLVTEGYIHTRSPKRYGARLLLFALISEIPFDLMAKGSLFFPGKQNVFFTLFCGVLLIHLYEALSSEIKKFAAMFLVMVGAGLLRADYGTAGACLIFLMYLLRDRPAVQAVVSYPLLSGSTAAFAAFLPIRMYNGKRGFIRSPLIAYSFYCFYPLHMLLLVLLRLALQK